MKKAVIVIPTYNEKPSIERLIPYLFEKTIPSVSTWNIAVLIVDGNSPDGTGVAVRELQKKYPTLALLVETEKAGIGAAYFKGFEYAEKEMAADVVIEFDGDFQHPPETIPGLLGKIEEGADLVMGSRRIKGGSIPRSWGFKRIFLSVVGGFVARFILFFPGRSFFRVTDPTTGLKATRIGEHFKKLNFSDFHSKSFSYKLEMLFHLVQSGAKVSEIPLVFNVRDEGESKIEGSTARETLQTVLKLRWNDETTRRFLKFGTVGFLGYLINAVSVEIFAKASFTASLAAFFGSEKGFYFLRVLHQQSTWAAVFATELAIVSNFSFNNLWTFRRDKVRGLKVISKFLSFNLTSLGAIILQALAIGSATMFLGDTSLVRQVTLVLAIALLVVPYNWLMYNKIIWKVKNAS